ncbi:hypothetical protein ACUOFC_49810, partial [Escherichia sp. TWPC-MK]
MLFQLARFGTGNSGFDGGFARINLFFWFRISLLLFQFARFGSGNSGFDGGYCPRSGQKSRPAEGCKRG